MPEVNENCSVNHNDGQMNLAFTTVYNLVGLSLATFGILRPVLAAVAQSRPDIETLGNSARLLKHEEIRKAPGISGNISTSKPVIHEINLYRFFIIALPPLQSRILYLRHKTHEHLNPSSQ
jgi:hypothetical protein